MTSTITTWLQNLLSSGIPSWLQSAIAGVTGSPILVIVAVVVLLGGGIFAWLYFVKPWIQAGKDVMNSAQVQATAATVQQENQDINTQVNDIFNKGG